ncbi:hypothetical protein HDU96_001224, partial [Phlyctochytrium bullatum]
MAKDSGKRVAENGDFTYRRSKRLNQALPEPYPSPREIGVAEGSDGVGDSHYQASGDAVRGTLSREDISPFVDTGDSGSTSLITPGSVRHRLLLEKVADDTVITATEARMETAAESDLGECGNKPTGDATGHSRSSLAAPLPPPAEAVIHSALETPKHGQGSARNPVPATGSSLSAPLSTPREAAVQPTFETPLHEQGSAANATPATGSSLGAPLSTPPEAAVHPPFETPAHEEGLAHGSQISALSAPPVYGQSPVPYDAAADGAAADGAAADGDDADAAAADAAAADGAAADVAAADGAAADVAAADGAAAGGAAAGGAAADVAAADGAAAGGAAAGGAAAGGAAAGGAAAG